LSLLTYFCSHRWASGHGERRVYGFDRLPVKVFPISNLADQVLGAPC
jgi:hypothetical protein